MRFAARGHPGRRIIVCSPQDEFGRITSPLNLKEGVVMATTDVARQNTGGQLERKRIVNDMSIQVATVNGSGSQSSNTVLLRAIFQMGVPISGKNLFPSNIAGLPTWYTIRANKDGYIGRKKEIDFLVAMNAETAQDDVMSLAPGASVLYDEPLALDRLRNDLIFYAVPYDKLVAAVCPEAKLRKLVKNMVYVGVVAQLLEVEMGEVEKAIRKQFAKKVKAANLNLGAAQAGFDYAKTNLQKRGVFYIERMDKTAGKIIIDGNSAAALGCMFAGGQRDGDRRRMGGCAQHDGHCGTGNFADVGVRWVSLLRGNSGRHLGHSAR